MPSLVFSCGRRAFSDEPGKEQGPIIEVETYIDVTHATLRHEGALVAFINTKGDWQIAEGYEGAGETYSDVTIS